VETRYWALEELFQVGTSEPKEVLRKKEFPFGRLLGKKVGYRFKKETMENWLLKLLGGETSFPSIIVITWGWPKRGVYTT